MHTGLRVCVCVCAPVQTYAFTYTLKITNVQLLVTKLTCSKCGSTGAHLELDLLEGTHFNQPHTTQTPQDAILQQLIKSKTNGADVLLFVVHSSSNSARSIYI